jgi:hypothetical protein
MQVRLNVLLFYLYLSLNFVISSLIVGTFETVCKTLLDKIPQVSSNLHNFFFSYRE